MGTALVTGTSYGIGEAIASKLLSEGWKVYGLSRSKGSLENENFTWLKCDLSKPDEISEAVKNIHEPSVDALISNAGVIEVENATAVSDASFQRTFSVNVLAPMLLVNHIKEKIKAASIISISSVADRLPESSIALYCSSKAANTSFFNALADELKDAKVVTILPDYVNTPMLHSTMDTDSTFDWSCTIKPDDIAQLCHDLLHSKRTVPSGSNIIVVTNALLDDLKSVETLYSFNTDTNELGRL